MPNKKFKTIDDDTLIMSWQYLATELKNAKVEESEMRKEIIERKFIANKKGTQTRELGNGWQLKSTASEKIAFDKSPQEVETKLHELAIKYPQDAAVIIDLLKWEPKLVKEIYDQLVVNPDLKKEFDDLIVKSLNSATLSIKPPKEKAKK